MKKKIILASIIMLFTFCINAYSYDEANAEDKAKKYHDIQEMMLTKPDLVTPDSIMITSEVKAVYYQNSQIIGLLRDIKSLLKQNVKYQQQQLEKNQKEKEAKVEAESRE